MRNRIILLVIIFLIVQTIVLAWIYGRSDTPSTAAWTPIPTLLPATLPAATPQVQNLSIQGGECRIAALDLIGSWVVEGKPETEPFPFADVEGNECEATFETDVMPLFHEPNVWFAGAMACTTCHGPDISRSAANMDLSDYNGILAGSRRAEQGAAGNDILGDENTWEDSVLYRAIVTHFMPPGRPPESPDKGPVIQAGESQ